MPARLRARPLGLVVPACLVAGAALAQEPVRVEIRDAGRPAAGIEVSVLVQGEPWSLGVTDAAGAVLAPLDLVGLVPGVFVEAQAVACGPRTGVLLVPPGESPAGPCRAAPDCRCWFLASFPWGDVALDLAPRPDLGRFDPDLRRPGRAEGLVRAPAPRSRIGAGAGIAGWPRLDRACVTDPAVQPVGCGLDAEAPTFRLVAEHRIRPDLPFAVAAEAGYTRGLAVEQRFAASANPREPVRNAVDLDVWTVGGYGVVTQRLGALDLFAGLGYVWSHHRVEATSTYASPDRAATETRTDAAGRLGGRAGVDWWREGAGWGVRIELGGMTGEEDDLGRSWHAAGLLLVAVGPR